MSVKMFRSKKLLEYAKECPMCFGCGEPNDGSVVAAHSNQQRDGKGMSMKAHDYRIAYMCFRCHSELDQGKNWNKQEKLEIWERAHRATIGWLFNTGKVGAK